MINVYRADMRNNKIQSILFACAVVFFILLSLLFVSSYIYHSNPIAKMADMNYERITVQEGDTLWELASKINTSMDTNTLVSKTIKYNNLKSTYIQPGQIIYVPLK